MNDDIPNHRDQRPLHELSVAEARAQERDERALSPRPFGPSDARLMVDDRAIPGPAGRIPIRVYRLDGVDPGPIVLYFHGGGWVLGGLDSGDALCRWLASAATCAVVSVDYRLAPEHPYPAAVEDCVATTRWVAAHAGDLGTDASRLVVAGTSAGGNLAAADCLRLRRDRLVRLSLQVLIYPPLMPNARTASIRMPDGGRTFTAASVAWCWRHYLSRPVDACEPEAAPLRARDLRGLPPALIITADHDPLRDEAEAYARRLQAAGVSVERTRYPGTIHGFLGDHTGAADRARKQIARAIRRVAPHHRRSLRPITRPQHQPFPDD